MSNFLIIVLFGFFRLVLTFLHLAYSGFQYFDLAWSLLKRKSKDMMQLQSFDTQLFVSRLISKLEKCPSHLVVVVGSDRISVEDFSNLVMWCLAAKISYISFYDHTGYLKANENIFYEYLIRKRKGDPKCLVFNSQKSHGKNGVLQKIHINFLSLDDGKPLFVQLAKKLTMKVILNEMRSSDINESLIEQEIFKLCGMPEPELGLICGTVCGTFGLSPWHIRTTEFIQVKSIKGIQVSDFASILMKYASCTQRFGK